LTFIGSTANVSTFYGNIIGTGTSSISNVVSGNITCSNISVTYGANIGTSGNVFALQGILYPLVIGAAMSDEVTTITITSNVTIFSPYSFNITNNAKPVFSLNRAPASGAATFNIQINGTTIYSAQPAIGPSGTGNGATLSTGNGTGSLAGTLTTNPTNVPQYANVYVTCTAAGTGTPCGAKFWMQAS
jgi:hypothetical protein